MSGGIHWRLFGISLTVTEQGDNYNTVMSTPGSFQPFPMTLKIFSSDPCAFCKKDWPSIVNLKKSKSTKNSNLLL